MTPAPGPTTWRSCAGSYAGAWCAGPGATAPETSPIANQTIWNPREIRPTLQIGLEMQNPVITIPLSLHLDFLDFTTR